MFIPAYEIPSFYVAVVPSNADFTLESSGQFVAVMVKPATGAGLSGPATDLPVAGGSIMGVQQNNPMIGEVSTVMVHGISKARLSGPVVEGSELMVDAAGKFLVATVGNHSVAIAMSSGIAGDVCPILLKSNGKV